MTLEQARKRLAYLTQEEEALRAYIATMEALGERPPGLPFPALPVRARNIMRWAIIDRKGLSYTSTVIPTPEDVAAFSKGDLLRVANCGKKTVKDIEQWLASHGLELGP
jgi:hypothetical protein